MFSVGFLINLFSKMMFTANKNKHVILFNRTIKIKTGFFKQKKKN